MTLHEQAGEPRRVYARQLGEHDGGRVRQRLSAAADVAPAPRSAWRSRLEQRRCGVRESGALLLKDNRGDQGFSGSEGGCVKTHGIWAYIRHVHMGYTTFSWRQRHDDAPRGGSRLAGPFLFGQL